MILGYWLEANNNEMGSLNNGMGSLNNGMGNHSTTRWEALTSGDGFSYWLGSQ
ncbi:MAG: hypothetical protein IPM42_05165 [Saprospiraceae bacterium]|nr:hypothetical protein [Saprospiraceae bacterium]